MIRRLRSIWIWGASASVIVFWCPVLAVVWLFDHDPVKRRTGRWYRSLGRVLGKINPWRIHLSGAENKKPGQAYVVVSNHQSLADIPLIAHQAPCEHVLVEGMHGTSHLRREPEPKR